MNRCTPAWLPAAFVLCACQSLGGDVSELELSYTTVDVVLDPAEAVGRPASATLTIANPHAYTLYVSPSTFVGEGTEVLTVQPSRRDQELPPEASLDLRVQFTPAAEVWARGGIEGSLELIVGAFTSDANAGAPAEARRQADPSSWIAQKVSLPFTLSWRCDLDEDGVNGRTCGGDDCDDTDAAIKPGAEELCDEIDNDCDSMIDEDPPNEGTTWFKDADEDTYGDEGRFTRICGTTPPGKGYVKRGGDCDDDDAEIAPNKIEVCGDDIDQDCVDGADNGCAVDTDTDVLRDDRDGDGLKDDEEDLDGDGVLDPGETDPDDSDTDDDGLSDGAERKNYGSDPRLKDTDSDGVDDYAEVIVHLSNPRLADTDLDGLEDGEELLVPCWSDSAKVCPTSLTKADTDEDGLTDAEEVLVWFTDPLDRDTDDDQLDDGLEITHDCDPFDQDTDDDGAKDGVEVVVHGASCRKSDTDEDGIGDAEEIFRACPAVLGCTTYNFIECPTDPNASDTDLDGLSDADEINVHGTDPLEPDSDCDGLDDAAEIAGGADPLDPDSDDDGLSDFDELTKWFTNPKKKDTDGDGYEDAYEIDVLGTSPRKADTDGDGLTDGAELMVHETDPTDNDSDDDGLFDGEEIAAGTDPHLYDTDEDLRSDGDELKVQPFTDPLDQDSDDDGLIDGLELFAQFPPSDPNDPDSDDDLLNDLEEFNAGSRSDKSDTDEDGISDYDEVKVYRTKPDQKDTDADGLDDFAEIFTHGTSALHADTDEDGINDFREINEFHTNPLVQDTDNDGLTDPQELDVHHTLPNVADTDEDGLKDGAEVTLGSNPLVKDTDMDGLEDGEEVNDAHSSPILVDTDRDGLDDYMEFKTLGTNPSVVDSDTDGLNDGDEIEMGTDPLVIEAHVFRGLAELVPGDLVISEVFTETTACADAQIEYVEIANVSGELVKLQGVTLDMRTGILQPLAIRSAPDWVLTPGEHVTLGHKPAGGDPVPCFKGWTTDYVWSSALLLNTYENLALKTKVATVTKIIDRVDMSTWTSGGSGFDLPRGASLSLDGAQLDATDNDQSLSWCNAVDVIPTDPLQLQKGTPGEPNPSCSP
ncbi:MAG: hypothetical protein H6732_10940 [Alphaproteobacteria bacterium]|nr:hypothetical protein [Alphaproteobacteria bacterium]